MKLQVSVVTRSPQWRSGSTSRPRPTPGRGSRAWPSCARPCPGARDARASWSGTTPPATAPARSGTPVGNWRNAVSGSGTCRPRPGVERHRTHLPDCQARGHAPAHLHDHRGPDGSRGDRLRAGQGTADTFRLIRLSIVKCLGRRPPGSYPPCPACRSTAASPSLSASPFWGSLCRRLRPRPREPPNARSRRRTARPAPHRPTRPRGPAGAAGRRAWHRRPSPSRPSR